MSTSAGASILAANVSSGITIGATNAPFTARGSTCQASGASSLILQSTDAGSSVNIISPSTVAVNPGPSGITGTRTVTIQGQTTVLDGYTLRVGPNANAAAGATVAIGSSSTLQTTIQAASIVQTATNSIQLTSTSGSGIITINAPTIRINAGTLDIPSGTVNFLGGTINGVFASGMILMYTGEYAPSGWRFCDGTNGTPDLRGRFVIGANPMVIGSSTSGAFYTSNPGTTGGSQNVVADHQHQTWDTKYCESNWPSYYNSINNAWPYRSTNFYNVRGVGASSDNDNQPSGTVERTGATSGLNSTVVTKTDTRPPYYALAYIMKI
jgi:hypothetical protein